MDRGERRREGVFQDYMFCRGFGQTLVILEGYQCATAEDDTGRVSMCNGPEG